MKVKNCRKNSSISEKVQQLLPPRDTHHDYWWNKTLPQLVSILDAAQYPPERQYEVLLFHHHWVTPALGKAFGSPDGGARWPSILGVDGLPIEYSWKWNTTTKRPEVRYTIEPLNALSGTATDPLNQDASREFLHRVGQAFPYVDVSGNYHFLNTLYDHDRSKYALEAATGEALRTTIMVAIEFVPQGISLKTYFLPRKLGTTGGALSIPEWEESLRQLDRQGSTQALVWDLLKTNPKMKLMKPFMVAIDNVAPADSRLKLYCRTSCANFALIRETMTLGGRLRIPDSQLEELRSLVAAVIGMDAGFSETMEWPTSRLANDAATSAHAELPAMQPALMFYFDMASRAALPSVKLFLMTRHYGPDDWTTAQNLTAWMAAHGRGHFCDGYLAMLRFQVADGQLAGRKGVHSYISCSFTEGGELDVTSYFIPRGLAPVAQSPGSLSIPSRRSLRRRDN